MNGKLIGRCLLIGAFALIVALGLKLGLHNKALAENHLEVLYFWAEECPWSKSFEPIWNNFATNSRLNNISLSVVSPEIHKELADKFNIRLIPSLVIVKNNRKHLVVDAACPLIYQGQTITGTIPKEFADKIRPWNECELAHFIKEKTIPKEMPCETKPY